jgi:hypothetical protein
LIWTQIKYVKAEYESTEAYDRLLNSFSSDFSIPAECYPDYFGGAYINIQDGSLILCVVYNHAVPPEAEELLKDAGHTIQAVSYSYKRLHSVYNKIGQLAGENGTSSISKNIISWSILDDQNAIEVELQKCDATSVDAFKKALDIPDTTMLTFVQGTPITEDELTNGEAGIGCGNIPLVSCACRVREGANTYGFLSCGHHNSAISTVFNLYQPPMNVGSQPIYNAFASVQRVAYYGATIGNMVSNSSKCDASYMRLSQNPNNQNAIARATVGGIPYAAAYNRPLQFATVSQHGAVTNALQYGRITSATHNYTVHSNNVNPSYYSVTDTFKYNIVSVPGDSGALVFYNGNFFNMLHIAPKIVGIESSSSPAYSRATKMGNILKALNAIQAVQPLSLY